VNDLKLSGDGSKIVFATGPPFVEKKIYTINADGSGQTEIYDYANHPPRDFAPFNVPFIDINHDGSRIIWSDSVDEIYAANADGTGQHRIATEFAAFDGTVTGPRFDMPPRLTAGGTKVIFAHSAPGPGKIGADFAGLFEVGFDGNNKRRLFSYADFSAAIFGADATEYNINEAFSDLDISDDGSRLIIGTHQLGGAIATYDGLQLRRIATGLTNRNRSVAISGDGQWVAHYTIDEGKVIRQPFAASGSPLQLTQWLEGSTMRMAYDGTLALPQVTAGGTLFHPATGRNDIALPQGARLHSPSADARRIAYLSSYGTDLIGEQIWICDIDPPSLDGAPSISEVTFAPDYVLSDFSTASTFSARVTPGASALNEVIHQTLRDGRYIPAALTNGILNDGGYGGDIAAADGLFTAGDVRANYLSEPGPLTPRIIATAFPYITAADAGPFTMTSSYPDSSDTDDDGIVLLLEEAFGLNPEVPDVAGLPRGAIVEAAGQRYLGITLRRLRGGTLDSAQTYTAGNLAYAIEVSCDLTGWVSGSGLVVQHEPATDLGGMVEEVTFRLADPAATSLSCFLRVRVIRLP
jgi:hypothetical protein